MSTDSSKVCPTDKATLAASLKQLCTGTNAYSKAHQALEKCESPEESIGSSPIYGTCGLTFIPTPFCGDPVTTPSIEVGTGTIGGNGVSFKVKSSIEQCVLFTAVVSDNNGTEVDVKCLGVMTVIPSTYCFEAGESIQITVTVPFINCTSTGTYYFKLCAQTDNSCINCIIGTIEITTVTMMIGATLRIKGTQELDGTVYGSYTDENIIACAAGGFECPNPCLIPCTLISSFLIYDLFVSSSINNSDDTTINLIASGDCPGGASCCFGPNPPANCDLPSEVNLQHGYAFIGYGSGSYGLCLENLQVPGLFDTAHDISFSYTLMHIEADDCTNRHKATFAIYSLMGEWHCYGSFTS